MKRPYYAGLLKAAELHGASHHAVMEFQVVTDKQFSKIRAGRSWVTFYFRKDLESVRGGIVERKADTGKIKISSPELTALDLFRYMHVAGGIDAVATVLADLGENSMASNWQRWRHTLSALAAKGSEICLSGSDRPSARRLCTITCPPRKRCRG